MDNVARLSTAERLELFSQVAARKNLAYEVVEKDFWVCWVLDVLFGIPELKDCFIFKGGTSLSKCFKIIERFSEDVDISIKRETLGFIGERDPENQDSNTKAKKLVDALRAECQRYVKHEIYPKFDKTIMERTGIEKSLIWSNVLQGGFLEHGVIEFVYPRTKHTVPEYIPQAVRIEFGASSDPYPVIQHVVKSYIEEEFPHLFNQAQNNINHGLRS